MSDRRPEKLHDPAKALEWWRATGSKMAIVELYEAVTNPVAAVRREVESGTIEGEVTKVEHDYYDHHASDGNLVKAGTYLVIPVDGEES